LLVAVILLAVAGGTVGALAWYGSSNGAIVDFSFGGANNVRQSYELSAMSTYRPSTIDLTHIIIRNTGMTGISVVVTMHASNAVVSTGYYGPYSDTANVQISLIPGLGYQVVTFYLTLPMQVTTFTLQVTVGRTTDFSSITALAASSFSPIESTIPTTLVYAQAHPNSTIYTLTQAY
jgi:hypothetical protein